MKKTLLLLSAFVFVSIHSTNLRAAAHLESERAVPDQIKAKIGAFYNAMAEAEYEAAFAHIAPGSRGYVPYGMLRELPTKQVIEMVVEQYEEDADDGGEIKLLPKNIVVSMHGSVAIATFYIDGTIRNPDEDRRGVIGRATMVWEKKGDDWKIVHWHMSELSARPSDD